MQTAYDLLLQAAQPAEPFDADRLEAAIVARGGVRRADGAVRWVFPAGEIVALRLREAGMLIGLELKVPFSDRPELLMQVASAAVELAKDTDVRLVDPQLNRTVLDAEGASMVDEFLRISRYAGQYHGLGDALSAPLPTSDESLSPVTKGVLALLVFAVALGAALQFFTED